MLPTATMAPVAIKRVSGFMGSPIEVRRCGRKPPNGRDEIALTALVPLALQRPGDRRDFVLGRQLRPVAV